MEMGYPVSISSSSLRCLEPHELDRRYRLRSLPLALFSSPWLRLVWLVPEPGDGCQDSVPSATNCPQS
uniref:Uncharacterized protein n=1 Tax=Setaria viridis TaxID=4556 RepID=A0A4U6USD6_SETVI|nr:hypothetical protein SEVIR_4G022701v2 [Setaria viridis]